MSSDWSAGPGDVSAHSSCISDESSHSGDPDQVRSDDDLPPEINVDLVSYALPPVSARVSQCSPPEAPVVRSADSSAPISPNRVRLDSILDTLDVGPVFEVSPDTTGFLMRPMDVTMQATSESLPIESGSESDCAPVLGSRWPLPSADRFQARMPWP